MRLPNRFLISILLFITVKCNEVQHFNEILREYSDNKDNVSSSNNVRTLQTDQLARYTNFIPSKGPIVLKDISDNDLASSNHVKGLSSQSKIGYEAHDYNEHGPEYGHYSGHDFYIPNIHELDHHNHHDDHDHHNHHSDHDHHNHHGDHDHHNHYGDHDHHNHHDDHHDHHGLGHGYDHHKGYHHKHYDHGLATKAILWPIAGIAILGAAAALVSNPILLQLGVVSGKRRRRDTEEITGPDFESNFLKTLKKHNANEAINESVKSEIKKEKTKRSIKKIMNQDKFLKKEHRRPPALYFPQKYLEDERLVPIPLQIRPKNT